MYALDMIYINNQESTTLNMKQEKHDEVIFFSQVEEYLHQQGLQLIKLGTLKIFLHFRPDFNSNGD